MQSTKSETSVERIGFGPSSLQLIWAFLAVIMVLVALVNMVASMKVRSASDQIDQWRQDKGAMTAEQWENVKHDLELASCITLFSRDAYRLLSDGYSLRSRQRSHLNKDERSKARKMAIQYLSEALVLNPTWPYHWANLAVLKMRDGNPVSDLEVLLDRALLLGPGEPGVQRVAVMISLRHWKHLSEGIHSVAEANLWRMLKRDPVQTITLAKRYGHLPLLCESGIKLVELRHACQ